MQIKAITVFVGILFAWSSVSIAGEAVGTSNVVTSDETIAMQYDQQEILRQLVTQVKPAAGVEVSREVKSQKHTPYWQQKVMRQRRGSLSE